MILILFCVAPACGTLQHPVNGSGTCRTSPTVTYCGPASCNGNKVLFNATGLYGARVWVCDQNYEWAPSNAFPDCVGKFDNSILL
jgi:hypothetical protein